MVGGTDDGETIRVFPFGALEILGAIESQQGGDRVVCQTIQQQHAPTQGSGRNARASDRMPHVVLTIAKRSLAILPRFPPVHGSKADKKGVRGKFLHEQIKAVLRQLGAQLQRMLLGGVVMQTRERRHAGDSVDEQVTFGRMQVAARRIGSKRPPHLACLLPGRNRQRILKKSRNAANSDRGADDRIINIKVVVKRRAWRLVRLQQR